MLIQIYSFRWGLYLTGTSTFILKDKDKDKDKTPKLRLARSHLGLPGFPWSQLRVFSLFMLLASEKDFSLGRAVACCSLPSRSKVLPAFGPSRLGPLRALSGPPPGPAPSSSFLQP